MVVVEVIDTLTVLEGHVVYIAYLGGPLEVVVWRPDVLVLEPAFLDQSLSELGVSSFDNEYSLVVTHSVFALPCLEVHNFLLFFKFFLLNLLVLVIVHLFLLFLLAGAVGSDLTFGFVLQASQLFIGKKIKLDPSFIFALGFLILEKSFLNLVGLERRAHIVNLPF